MYHPDSEFIPPTADKYIFQTQLSGFFQNVWDSGVHNVTIVPKTVVQEAPDLIHEIGLLNGAGFLFTMG
eukprot:UN27740